MSNTHFGIALLGFGTVGRGVYDLLAELKEGDAKNRFSFEVKRILVRDLVCGSNFKRFKGVPRRLLTTQFRDILRDPNVDVVIEVMGGEHPAKQHIFDALKAGKDVITANKQLMGHRGEELVGQALRCKRYLGFLASVTGCHQLCRSIVRSFFVDGLMGIFNGTSNYILTRMEEGLNEKDALAEAQAKGYAEANPSNDIDGIDTRNKLMVVSKLAFGVFLRPGDVPTTGIRNVVKRDMDFARELGSTIKLIGMSKRGEDGRIEAQVEPCLIPCRTLLASVRGIHNGIQVRDRLRGNQGMTAEGAGSRPTAMAILSDLLSLAEKEEVMWPDNPQAKGAAPKSKRLNRLAKHYARIEAKNHPGVLAQVTKVFGRHKINIESLIQHKADGPVAPIAVVCGPTSLRALWRSLREMESLKPVLPGIVHMRIEEDAI